VANQILVQIHDYVSRQMEADRQRLSGALLSEDDAGVARLAGKVEQWQEIRDFLHRHFDLITVKYY
jgi:anti-sigma factor RsiW